LPSSQDLKLHHGTPPSVVRLVASQYLSCGIASVTETAPQRVAGHFYKIDVESAAAPERQAAQEAVSLRYRIQSCNTQLFD
jgi:hypothetical protein